MAADEKTAKKSGKAVEVDGAAVARGIVRRALPMREAERLQEVFDAAIRQPLQVLERFADDELVHLLSSERPQTVALILAHLPAQRAAHCLKAMRPEAATSALERVARLGFVNEEMLAELSAHLEEVWQARARGVGRRLGGVETLVRTLRAMDEASEKKFLADLAGRDPALHAAVLAERFTFDDLIKIDERGLQELLRKVDGRQLVTALRGAGAEILSVLMRNMSAGRRQGLQDELAHGQPVRKSEVEEARRAIVALALQLCEAGELVIERQAS